MTVVREGEEGFQSASSLFAAFDQSLFVPRPSWGRIRAILDAKRGGNYGLTGPRGAGKTWLMRRAVAHANEDGLGLWFPSPSEYDPRAFLAALSEVLAQEYIQYYLLKSSFGTELQYRQKSRQIRYVSTGMVLASFVLFFIGWAQTTSTPITDLPYINLYTILAFILYLGAYLVFVLRKRIVRRLAKQKDPESQLYDKAIELRRKARFTTALKEATESSASAGAKGISAALKRSAETALSERPATISSMINDFRSFSQELALMLSGPVVIAIDELDKMDSPSAMAALLRDIKGIFDVPGVHFFVSISDEAARSLDLGAIQKRNEFNSSFYQVFELGILEPEQCVDMLQRRGVQLDEVVVSRLYVLAGGIPREVIRLADIVINTSPDSAVIPSPTLEVALMRHEVSALQREIETSAKQDNTQDLTDEDKVRSLSLVRQVSDPTLLTTTDFLCTDYWTPSWASSQWSERYGEQWRRLLVRIAIAAELCNGSSTIDAAKVVQLQEVVSRTALSAAIGRDLLRDYKTSPQIAAPGEHNKVWLIVRRVLRIS
jgi:KAP family P-loop domain